MMDGNQTTIADLTLLPDFISAIAKLLWPIVTAFAVWIFRTDIRSLIERLDTAKFGKNELRFAKEIIELKNTVNEVITESKEAVKIGHSEEAYTANKGAPVPTKRIHFQDQSLESWELQNKENISRAKKYVTPEQPLFSRSLTWRVGTDLPDHIKRNPHEAIFLIQAELESAILDILLNDGAVLKNDISLSRLATILASKRNLSPEFGNAVRQFAQLRNRIAHSSTKIPDKELVEVANSGLHLLDLVGRLPREHIIVHRAEIPVFVDEACKFRANEYEGLQLIFAAMEGRTGSAMNVVSNKVGQYQAGQRVSAEWGDVTRTDLWMLGVNDKLNKILAESKIFVGHNIKSLIYD